uniref:Uncharacterized protein n=1 Tax=Mesocestoides corti TaxID=53468 RepID=A0A5K3G2I8_MESCO
MSSIIESVPVSVQLRILLSAYCVASTDQRSCQQRTYALKTDVPSTDTPGNDDVGSKIALNGSVLPAKTNPSPETISAPLPELDVVIYNNEGYQRCIERGLIKCFLFTVIFDMPAKSCYFTVSNLWLTSFCLCLNFFFFLFHSKSAPQESLNMIGMAHFYISN